MGDVMGQNLVLNGSFENHISCGGDSIGFGMYYGDFPPWDDPTNATPDGFNACSIASPNFLAPSNYLGFQSPHSGAGYVGTVYRNTESPNHCKPAQFLC